MAAERLPGTRPTVLETLAVTAGRPQASSVGKVTRVPDPTTALIVPAATPASRTASASQTEEIRSAHRWLVGWRRARIRRRGGRGRGARRGPPPCRRGGLLGGADRLLPLLVRLGQGRVGRRRRLDRRRVHAVEGTVSLHRNAGDL